MGVGRMAKTSTYVALSAKFCNFFKSQFSYLRWKELNNSVQFTRRWFRQSTSKHNMWLISNQCSLGCFIVMTEVLIFKTKRCYGGKIKQESSREEEAVQCGPPGMPCGGP